MFNLKKPTPEQIAASMARPLPTTASGGQGDGPAKKQVRLHIDKIYRFERNPRSTTNAQLLNIKESIRAVGQIQMFDVTQRPADLTRGMYVQSKGGGTRLEALRALYEEDVANGVANSRFEYVFCMLHPYVDELTIEAGHLAENMQRAQMTYWDTAVGMMRFKESIEAVLGKPLALRDLEDEVTKLGMGVSFVTLSLYYFGYTYFNDLGSKAAGLSATKMADTLRPAYLAIQRLGTRGDAAGAPALTEEAFHEAVAAPALRAYASELGEDGVLDAAALARQLEQACAAAMGFDAKQFASLSALAKQHPTASLAELLGRDVRTTGLFAPDATAKAAPSESEDGSDNAEVGGGEPPAPPAASPAATPYERPDASGELGVVTDAQMAALEIESMGVGVPAPSGANNTISPISPISPSSTNTPNTPNVRAASPAHSPAPDPLATTIAASIGAALAASFAAIRAGQEVTAATGSSTPPAQAQAGYAPAPLIGFTGAESSAQILDRVAHAVRERVRFVAACYDIADCVMEAPLLPLGFVMELPAQPLDNNATAEAWWYLSYLSTLNLLDPLAIEQFMQCLPKAPTGEDLALAEFLGYVLNDEMGDAQSLIGVVLNPVDLGAFFWALAFPLSPCSEVLMELMQLIRILNQFQSGLLRHPCLPPNTPLAQVHGLLLNGGSHGA